LAKDVVIDLTQTNNEAPNVLYTAQPGDKVIMKLNENPTTGYSWSLLNLYNSANDKQVLNLEKQEYIPNKSQNSNDGETLYGAGGIKYYNFVAKNEGQETLELIYAQVWTLGPIIDQATGTVNWHQAEEKGIDLIHMVIQVTVTPDQKPQFLE